jgi:hypothetical protein
MRNFSSTSTGSALTLVKSHDRPDTDDVEAIEMLRSPGCAADARVKSDYRAFRRFQADWLSC